MARVLERTAAAAAVVVLVLAAAACGGSSKKADSTTAAAATTTGSTAASQAAYANGVCGALASWKSSLTSLGKTFQDYQNLSKTKLQDAAKSVSDANTKLANDVKALGPPPKDAGPKAKAAVQDLSTELQSSAKQIKDATANLSSTTDVLQAVNTATAALLKMSADISATITTLESLKATQSWRKAFSGSETCQSLSKS